jgi:hypothetical protein
MVKGQDSLRTSIVSRVIDQDLIFLLGRTLFEAFLSVIRQTQRFDTFSFLPVLARHRCRVLKQNQETQDTLTG